MKILIAYASAGSGHFKAAQALYDYIKEECPQISLRLTDVLEKANPLFRFFYSRGYSFLVRHLILLWRLFFWLTNFKGLRPVTRLAGCIFNRLNTQGFVRFLIQDNPDFIISTHFLPAELSANLKRAKKIKSRLVTIITDFGVHPFWISDATDIYVVACEFTKRQLLLEGVAENRIKGLGIPIEEKFLKQYDRKYLSNKLNIDGNKFTVLIMTGSFGLGPLEEIVNALYRDVQILVVCANNKKLYARLTYRNLTDVKVFGLVDNVQELMAVSDIIITKPGGLSISEVLNMELAPVFISSIPGQEECNARILKGYGIGLIPESIKDIKNIVLDLKNHQYKLKNIRDNIKRIKKPDALREICNVVCQGSAGLSCPGPI
jgi:processive 1,2-diacylglycerol beta-glucosyltransferase